MNYLEIAGKLVDYSKTLDVGTSQAIVTGNNPVSVFVTPSGSVDVEITSSPIEAIESGTAEWFSWAKGVVSAKTNDGLLLPVRAIRFVVTTSSCVCEILGSR